MCLMTCVSAFVPSYSFSKSHWSSSVLLPTYVLKVLPKRRCGHAHLNFSAERAYQSPTLLTEKSCSISYGMSSDGCLA